MARERDGAVDPELPERPFAFSFRFVLAKAEVAPYLAAPSPTTTNGKGVDAVLVQLDPVLYSRIREIIALAASHSVPTIYFSRECAELGGLMSYGPDVNQVLRQAGVYAARILNGEKPGELPVQHPTKFELVVNVKTANALGLTIPPSLLARADEVIE